MDKSVASAAPYFDAGEVGRELMAFIEAQQGQAQEARPAVLDKLKQLLRNARIEAARQLAAHGTRTVEQSLKLSRADITIRTALLDARLILGDQSLFEELTRRFRREVVSGTARQFVEAKLAERDERHRRAGESRYRVEPNIKDGKGGLRDLHTLHWLAKYLYGSGLSAGAVEAAIFT